LGIAYELIKYILHNVLRIRLVLHPFTDEAEQSFAVVINDLRYISFAFSGHNG
jgi:hypothetical protein